MSEDYGDLPLEDFTHGIYHNLLAIKVGVWVIVGLEIVRFFV